MAAFAFPQNGTPVLQSIFVIIAQKFKIGKLGIKSAYKIKRFFVFYITEQINIKIIAEIAVATGLDSSFVRLSPAIENLPSIL